MENESDSSLTALEAWGRGAWGHRARQRRGVSEETDTQAASTEQPTTGSGNEPGMGVRRGREAPAQSAGLQYAGAFWAVNGMTLRAWAATFAGRVPPSSLPTLRG